MNRRFDSSTDSKTEKDVKTVIEPILEGKIPEQIKVSLKKDEFIESGEFKTKEAYIKGLIGLLISLTPKSLKKNSEISFNASWAAKSDRNNFHHFFPQNMKGQNWTSEPVNNICNIILSDASTNQIDIGNDRSSVYIPALKNENNSLENTLKAHLILDLDNFGVLSDQFDLFVSERAYAFIAELKSRLIVIDDDKIEDHPESK